jgi:hypothetical protein
VTHGLCWEEDFCYGQNNGHGSSPEKPGRDTALPLTSPTAALTLKRASSSESRRLTVSWWGFASSLGMLASGAMSHPFPYCVNMRSRKSSSNSKY